MLFLDLLNKAHSNMYVRASNELDTTGSANGLLPSTCANRSMSTFALHWFQLVPTLTHQISHLVRLWRSCGTPDLWDGVDFS